MPIHARHRPYTDALLRIKYCHVQRTETFTLWSALRYDFPRVRDGIHPQFHFSIVLRRFPLRWAKFFCCSFVHSHQWRLLRSRRTTFPTIPSSSSSRFRRVRLVVITGPTPESSSSPPPKVVLPGQYNAAVVENAHRWLTTTSEREYVRNVDTSRRPRIPKNFSEHLQWPCFSLSQTK